MKIYRVIPYNNEIKELEASRANEKTVWIKSVWNGEALELRCKRHTPKASYFDTKQEARKFLSDILDKRLAKAKRDLKKAKDDIKAFYE